MLPQHYLFAEMNGLAQGLLEMISSFFDRGIAFICASRTRAFECVKPSC
jgi:hypothetical protein